MPHATLITPTGNRQEAFSLCEKWISKQTYTDFKWLVVDDCFSSAPTKCTLGQTVLPGPMAWAPGINTQRSNLDIAFQYTDGDYVFVIEDDDYYAPEYLEVMVDMLKHVDAVGIADSPYYHLKVPGFRTMQNFRHASLSQTGFTRDCLSYFYEAIHSGQYYMDIELWKKLYKVKASTSLTVIEGLTAGIKGMPGREGLGAGHSKKDYSIDKNLVMLKRWVGDSSVDAYLPFIGAEGVERIDNPKSFWRDRYMKSYGYTEL